MDVFSLIVRYNFLILADTLWQWLCILIASYQGYTVSVCPLLLKLTLIIWFHCCLPGFSSKKNNEKREWIMGSYFNGYMFSGEGLWKLCKYPSLNYAFNLLILFIHIRMDKQFLILSNAWESALIIVHFEVQIVFSLLMRAIWRWVFFFSFLLLIYSHNIFGKLSYFLAQDDSIFQPSELSVP